MPPQTWGGIFLPRHILVAAKRRRSTFVEFSPRVSRNEGSTMTTQNLHTESRLVTAEFFHALEVERTQALVRQDVGVAERLHAPDYQLITPSGVTFTRERYLSMVAAAPFYAKWAKRWLFLRRWIVFWHEWPEKNCRAFLKMFTSRLSNGYLLCMRLTAKTQWREGTRSKIITRIFV